MRSITWCVLFLFLAMGSPVAVANDARTWTTRSGGQADAAFVRESSGMIVLKKTDGSMIQVARSSLSTQDVAYLNRVQSNPKTVVASFSSHMFQGRPLFTEVKDFDNTKAWGSQGKDQIIFQNDTVRLRVKGQYDNEWGDDSTWKVVSTEDIGQRITGNEDWKEEKRTTDGKFVRVVFIVSNTSKTERTIPLPELVDSKDRTVTIIDHSNRFIDTKYTDPEFFRLGPGFSKTCCVIFEVANDAVGLKLRIFSLDSYDFSGDGRYVSVGHKQITLNM